MVETLTDKNLELGEQIESLKETVQELVGSKFIWGRLYKKVVKFNYS